MPAPSLPLPPLRHLRMALLLCLCAVVLAFAGCASLIRAIGDMMPKPTIETIVSPDLAKAQPKTIFIQEDNDNGTSNRSYADYYQIIVAEFQKAVLVKGYSQTEDIKAADAVLKIKIVQVQIQTEIVRTGQSAYTDYTAVVKLQASLVNKAGVKLWIGTGGFDTSVPGGTAVADVVKRVASELAGYVGLNAAEEKAKQRAAELAQEKAAEGK